MKTFTNDIEAIHEVTKGNVEAYRYLFDNHFADLCNFLLIYLHDKRLAEEIALDIYTHVWEKREDIAINSSFKSFLFAAAKNKAISQYRKEQRKINSPLEVNEYKLTDNSSSQSVLENKELYQLINQAVDDLPEKSKLIYRMAWEQNLPYKDIAKKLELSVKTVENHVGIALRKLRKKLKPYYEQLFILWITSNFL